MFKSLVLLASTLGISAAVDSKFSTLERNGLSEYELAVCGDGSRAAYYAQMVIKQLKPNISVLELRFFFS